MGLGPWEARPALRAPGASGFRLPLTPCPVHPNKVSETEKSELVNETRWQYYGTAGITGNLTVTWEPSALSTQSVIIELWGYEETGKASPRLARRCCSVGPEGWELGAYRGGSEGIPGRAGSRAQGC